MRYLLALFCFLTLLVPVLAEDTAQPFEPADHSFSLKLPGKVRVVSQEDGKFLWGTDDGSRSYLFGYSLLPRAAGMQEETLRAGLEQFLTSYLQSAKITEKSRAQITCMGYPGIDGVGTASYGASWIRLVAVGPRIYVLTSDGTAQSDHQAYAESFKLAEPKQSRG